MTDSSLATTSEGLWLAAAKAGVTWLPPALRVRPVRAVADTVADHPGLAALQQAGVIHQGELRPDVAEWLRVLGRPDIEVDVLITRPDEKPAKLLGPPRVPDFPSGLEEAALALADWEAHQPAQRRIVVCRRAQQWVRVTRQWHPVRGLDEITIAGVDEWEHPAQELGSKAPVRFAPINTDPSGLSSALLSWQADPTMPNLMALTRIGLTPQQARIVEAVCDAGTSRASVSVAQFGIGWETRSPQTVTVADTLLGRVVIIRTTDLVSMLPGTNAAIDTAITKLCESLPCGLGWRTHQRIPERVPM